VGAGNVGVELLSVPFGSADRTYRLTFQGTKAATNVPQTTTNVAGLSISPPMGTSVTAVGATDAVGGVFNETQTLVLANATGGTWRLAYDGKVTARLATTATAGQVDAALEALSGIGAGNLTTTGSAGDFTITFIGAKANTNMTQVFGDAATAFSGTTSQTITTTYNNAGEVAAISDPAATTNFTRDNLGRATTVSNTIAGLTPVVAFNQAFDNESKRTQLSAVVGGTNDFKNDYTYDALNRLTDITQQSNGGNTVGAKHVTIGYNALGQRTSLNRYESLGTTNLVATTNWGYDSANRLNLIEHKRNSTTFASYAYSYDGLSRITSINSLVDGVSNFTYDATSQLTLADHTSQTDENYGYDLNGNRNTTGFTTGQNNQTLGGDGFTYTYDDEGNRTSRTETATGKVQEYTWDYRNRLTQVRNRNTAAGPIVMQVDYTYDALNRMVKRAYDADGAGSGATTNQYWAYDEGINALLEFNGSATTNLTHRYLWSDQVDELLADSVLTNLTTAGNALWALSDHLGTIRDIADYTSGTDSTAVTNHRVYNSYGKLISETNSAVDLIFGFTGKQYDDATGLQHNLFRWYDSNLGQWLSEDPLSFGAGDENVRRYVGNGPSQVVDRLGLQGFTVTPPRSYVLPVPQDDINAWFRQSEREKSFWRRVAQQREHEAKNTAVDKKRESVIKMFQDYEERFKEAKAFELLKMNEAVDRLKSASRLVELKTMDGKQGEQGKYDKRTNTLTISKNATQPMQHILSHELSHAYAAMAFSYQLNHNDDEGQGYATMLLFGLVAELAKFEDFVKNEKPTTSEVQEKWKDTWDKASPYNDEVNVIVPGGPGGKLRPNNPHVTQEDIDLATKILHLNPFDPAEITKQYEQHLREQGYPDIDLEPPTVRHNAPK
jgi:RHS repeat-associated protein